MPIDNASWHYDAANFPPRRPKENGGNHTGYFLTWILMNHLEGDEHKEDKSVARVADAVRTRKRTGRDFLFEICDEKFIEDDLSAKGLAFTEHYYDDVFNDDYFAVFGTDEEHMYEVDWTWSNYDKLAPVMDRRFAEWKASQARKPTKKAAPALKPTKKAAPPKKEKKKAKAKQPKKPKKPKKPNTKKKRQG